MSAPRRGRALVAALALVLVAAGASDAQQDPPGADQEEAVRPQDEALAWLVRHQAEDGRWDVDGWQARCGARPCDDAPLPAGAELRDVGLTATVTLAFVSCGHTQRFGRFKEAVARALGWLRARQVEDGSVVGEVPHAHALDDHALATVALCETYALSRDFTLRRHAGRALAACLAAQEPDGGWAHGASGAEGLARTARFVLALKTGKTCGLDVPQAAFERAHAWLSSRMVVHDLLRLGAHDPLRCTATRAALARLFCGERRSTPDLRAAFGALRDGARHDGACEAWAGTWLAMQLGGAAWRAWDRPVKDALLARTERDGCAGGSWAPGASCGVGGRVEATALAAMTLNLWRCYPRAGEE